MTRQQSLAYRFRWVLLGLAALSLAAGVITGAWIIDFQILLPDVCIPLGLWLLTQWFFLGPRRLWVIRLADTARPRRLAAISAALMAAVALGGLAMTVLEVMDLEPPLWSLLESILGGRGLYCYLALLWLFWSVVFLIYWRQGDRYTQLGRMIRGLLAGSIAELLVATVVNVFVPDRHNCWCARGSFFGLVMGLTVLFWTFGPGLVLLFLREKHRRLKLLEKLCPRCGYNLTGTLMAGRTECPECGAKVAAADP